MHANLLEALANDEIARDVILAAADSYRAILREECRRLSQLNYNRKFSPEAKAMIKRDFGRIATDQLIVNLSKIHPGRITATKLRLAGYRLGHDGIRIQKRFAQQSSLSANM